MTAVRAAPAPQLSDGGPAPVPKCWPGATVLIIATGPSLTQDDLMTAASAAKAERIRTIAVNDAWRSALWADMLYAADAPWWNYHEGAGGFPGEKWIAQPLRRGTNVAGQRACARRWGLRGVATRNAPGLSFDPALIHEGAHSGYQALNLAVLFGATRVALLGFDCGATNGKAHYFGEHPPELRRTSPYHRFLAAFGEAAPQLKDAGVEAINCSRETRLTSFRRAPIWEAL